MINIWIALLIFSHTSGYLNQFGFISDDGAKCKIDATVRDYTALDACRFLLELKDGTRLLPAELSDPGFLFSEGQLVKINYTEIKDVVTACMTAAIPIKLECIQEVKAGEKAGQVFFKKECFDTQSPLSIAWMNKAVLRNRVSEVKKGYADNKPCYVLYGNVNVMLYNCTGELLCEYATNSQSPCLVQVEGLTEMRSIWSQK